MNGDGNESGHLVAHIFCNVMGLPAIADAINSSNSNGTPHLKSLLSLTTHSNIANGPPMTINNHLLQSEMSDGTYIICSNRLLGHSFL